MYSVGMKLQEFATGEDGGGIAIDGEMFTLFIALKNPSLIERKELSKHYYLSIPLWKT